MSEEQLIATPGVFGENGNFLLERELGRGGMGGVYMGRDKMLDRPVAVKVMLKEYGSDPEFVEKFKREAQAVARLIHPNIAQVYSYGIADGMPYIAMELVAGGSLDALMKHQGAEIDVPRVMKICEQVAQALRCAADQGLVHGDVKPENILLDANGNAKLVDFGLAAMQKDTNEIWGTPYYIAPEKCKRQPVDYRADMYSLGGTIYHALTGVAPFEGDDANEVVRMRFMGPPKKPSEVRPGLSPEIDKLVMTMLAQEPKDRFPSFEALLEEFKKVMTVGLSITSPIDPKAADSHAAKPAAGKGGKKIVLKKKTFKPHHTGTVQSAGGDVPDLPQGNPAVARMPEPPKDDEEEEGGNLGLKVLGVVGGVIALIAAVAGGLVWYQASSKAKEEAETQRQIAAGFSQAHDSLRRTREAAEKFADEFDKFADETVKSCEKTTEELRKILGGKYSENILAMLKPAEPAELQIARGMMNAPVGAQAPTEEELKAVQQMGQQMAQALAGAMQQAVQQVATAISVPPPAKFRPPKDDEADPASPEGQEYAKAKAEFEAAEQKRYDEAVKAAQAGAAAPEAAQTPAEGAAQPEEVPSIVKDMNELWNKAYSVQAASYKIRRMVQELLAKVDAALAVGDGDEATMVKVSDTANEATKDFESIRGSKEVADAQKAKGYITSRGGRAIKQTVERLRIEGLERERKEAKEKAEREEKERQERLAAERAQKIETEVALVDEQFEKVVASGRLKQLDWKGARSLLDQVKLDISTPEAIIRLNQQAKRIDAMETAQNVLIANLKDYTFTKNPRKNSLKGWTVVSVDQKDGLKMNKPDGKRAGAVSWIKFYRDYHTNLNELINKFIRGGMQNGKTKLNLMKWSEAMYGTALTMQIVCSDDESAVVFANQLVYEIVKRYGKVDEEMRPKTTFELYKESFPELDIDKALAEGMEE